MGFDLMKNKELTFIDLFAGIGGFHLAFHDAGCKCVFASEIDKFARKTYETNFKKISPELFERGNYNSDILTQIPSEIPDFDILCAGFPCQPFSQAGYKRGFEDDVKSRGNMFYIIRDIIESKRPKAFLLENVSHLLKHDGGRTFAIIRSTIDELGYSFYYKIIKASDFGLPQHRPRIYMVGFDKKYKFPEKFAFPTPIPLTTNMSEIWGGVCNRDIGYTLRVGGKSSGLNDRRNWDVYLVDGEERTLGPEQGKKMMGFPADFELPVSRTQAMKQLGNSVAVNVVKAIAVTMVNYLKTEGADSDYYYESSTGKFQLATAKGGSEQ